MAEKTANDVPRDLRALYTKANEAAQRDNFDYAFALYCQVLEKEPGFFECRKALRGAQLKKLGGGGTGFFKKMLSGAGNSPQLIKAQAILRSNPAGAMVVAEQILNGDPNSSAAHRIIVDAAHALEMPKTAILSLEHIVRNSSKDKSIAIEYADAIAATGGDHEGGTKVLQELLRSSPNDPDLLAALKNLSARQTLDEGGYGALESGEGSYRDILRNKEEAVSLEQEKRVVQTEDSAARLIAEYESRLANEPNNLKMIRSLAELYTQKKQYDRALHFYDRLKNTDMGTDPSLDRAIADTRVRQFDNQIEQLNPFAADHAEQIEKLKTDKTDFQLAECQKRAEKYPTDMAIRFELGTLYFNAGKIGEAIGEFQKAQSNPNKRIAAMNYLAQCFAKRNMNDSAVRTFQNALKEKPVFDEEKKDLIYNLGCVLEKMGKKNESIEQFLIIYESDINYKDVGKKIDAHYASQGS